MGGGRSVPEPRLPETRERRSRRLPVHARYAVHRLQVWENVTLFVLAHSSQFRPGPLLQSPREEVRETSTR